MYKIWTRSINKSSQMTIKSKKEKYENIYSAQFNTFTTKYKIKKQCITGVTNDDKEKSFFKIDNTEYLFDEFINLAFGNNVAIREEDFEIVSRICFDYSTFKNCEFTNIVFENCEFTGCKFENCSILNQGVIFKNCGFSRPVIIENIDDPKNIPRIFTLFNISAANVKFDDCEMSGVIFEECELMLSCFSNSNLSDSIFQHCDFWGVELNNCDLRGTKIVKPVRGEFSIDDNNSKITKFDEFTVLDKIIYYEQKKEDFRIAAITYRIFAEQFKNNNVMEAYGEYFYLYKKTEKKYLKLFPDKILSFLSFLTCGYGERPFYSLIVSMGIVFLCAILYMLFGISYGNESICFTLTGGLPLSLFQLLREFITFLHFSLVTFTTVGYGNITPIGYSIVVSSIEMVLGVIMTGIWVSTLVRKMTR